MIGQRLGSYEIVAKIGQGGMGEVYRARDTRLNREVAVKVLPPPFASDPDRLARFQREAQLLAAVSHPNIAAIYGLEDSAGICALVLELVDGPTLADRIAQGPLPLDDALSIARQVADALEVAHGQGIVHRDLKPANIKVTPDGRVKVLDFGLAKLVEREQASARSSEALADSPTVLTPAVTMTGLILGTAPYMSPEQAKGQPVDKRADIWAFGCVLYEMLAGTSPFRAANVAETVATILERQPSWDRLPEHTPEPVRRLLQRCLEKDQRRRLHDIADARLEIEEALAPQNPVPNVSRRAPARRVIRAAAILLVTAVASAVLGRQLGPAFSPSAPAPVVARFHIASAAPLAEGNGLLAISPDGRRIAYAAGSPGRPQLFVRDLDQFDGKAVAGTDGVDQVAFSPNGQSLVFIADQKMKKVTLGGGTPLVLHEPATGVGLSWTDRAIFFNSGGASGIATLSADAGTVTTVTTTGAVDDTHQFPEALPNGKGLVYSAVGGLFEQQVYAYSFVAKEKKRLIRGMNPHYLPSGHLVYVQDGTLFAVRFDLERLDVVGTPTPLLEGIRQTVSGAALIAFSHNGTIAYVAANPESRQTRLVWVDQSGAEQPTEARGRRYSQPRLAPDDRRVVVNTGGTEDLWLYDFARGTSDRLTVEGGAFPAWAPDGRRLAFTTNRKNAYDIYVRSVDGSQPEQPLLAGMGTNYPMSWSPDGRLLAYVHVDSKTFQDLWLLPADGHDTARPLLLRQFREGGATFSPDGQWIAYVSDESGRAEVYVRPVTGQGATWTISADGGNEPVWPRKGHQLFYRNGDAVFAVEVQTSPTFSAGKPRKLFERHYEQSNAFWPNYDAAADGRRLLMVKAADQVPASTQINVVVNWSEELKARVPSVTK